MSDVSHVKQSTLDEVSLRLLLGDTVIHEVTQYTVGVIRNFIDRYTAITQDWGLTTTKLIISAGLITELAAVSADRLKHMVKETYKSVVDVEVSFVDESIMVILITMDKTLQ